MPTKRYNIGNLTMEEFEAAQKAIQKVRDENARLAQISAAKSILDSGIAMMIDLVGEEVTKTLLREKNRELRGV